MFSSCCLVHLGGRVRLQVRIGGRGKLQVLDGGRCWDDSTVTQRAALVGWLPVVWMSQISAVLEGVVSFKLVELKLVGPLFDSA